MFHFVILSGGFGSRLWPKSRENFPKQLLKLTNDYSLLQNTILRIIVVKNEIQHHLNDNNLLFKISIICNKEHIFIIENQLNELIKSENLNIKIQIICEPKGRDSAPAICISSLLGSKDDFTFVFPCDDIFDNNEFSRCCISSLKFLENSIVTFGIQPTRPETGYGYILTNQNEETIQFIEKPNLEKANEYYQQENYLWNAGIFIFKNENMIKCFEKYAENILISCTNTLEKTDLKKNIVLLDSNFSNCQSISVDYAIMENLCKEIDISFSVEKKTIAYLSYWNDIGSFSSLYEELLSQNIYCDIKNKNITKGDVLTFDTNNSYIDSEKGFISTIGIENLIIINTEDTLLVCNKDRTQDVKKVVDHIKKLNREEVINHKKVHRPWGWFVNLDENKESGFKIKKIGVYPGKRLSLQSHNYRSEHWVIVNGLAKVQVGKEELILKKDQNVYIPINTIHRIENIGEDLLEFTETQIGTYLGEDDIIRYQDDFGRL